MLTRSDELEQAVELTQLAAEKEGAEHLPEAGAMIEVPSALFELDGILKRVDIASVASNDLRQFMLAVAREETDQEVIIRKQRSREGIRRLETQS
jgi:phosphotransferase system enzyme I (PtsP)